MPGQAPFASFWFDCDSTLSSIEGVDVLSERVSVNLRDDVSALTHKAMEGELPLAQVYEQRLAMIAPGREDLDAAGHAYIQHLVPYAYETVQALMFLQKTVGIISGGLRQPVLMLAAHLGVPADCVFAVPVLLDADGCYRGFDRQNRLWQNGGKPAVLGSLPEDQRPLLFVGDGVTDLEAKDQVDLFVGFGGVVRRQAVCDNADAYIAENSLLPVLDIGLTAKEKQTLRQDQRFRDLLPKQGE
ncbi:MAG: HAD family hydrolase [Planctomycetota bacterium]|jgi:phosphoserine phosphatase